MTVNGRRLLQEEGEGRELWNEVAITVSPLCKQRKSIRSLNAHAHF